MAAGRRRKRATRRAPSTRPRRALSFAWSSNAVSFVQPALGAAAQRGLLLGGYLGCVQGSFVAVERVVERQTIVSRFRGLARAFQCGGGGFVLRRGVRSAPAARAASRAPWA